MELVFALIITGRGSFLPRRKKPPEYRYPRRYEPDLNVVVRSLFTEFRRDVFQRVSDVVEGSQPAHEFVLILEPHLPPVV